MSDHLDRATEDRAEVERLRTALIALIDGWEDTGRSDLHPLIRGAVLSAAEQVRDALWPEEADAPKPMPELTPEQERRIAQAPKQPWTPPTPTARKDR